MPPFSDTPIKYQVKERFLDYHNKQGEVIKDVLAREGIHESQEYLSENRAKNIEVEHSAIDFSTVIIGEKIRSVLDKTNRVNFND